jgi:diguanylate cyclase (GGDEF)-like protein
MTAPMNILVCRHYIRETQEVLKSESHEGIKAHPFAPACAHPQKLSTVKEQIFKDLCSEGCHSILVGGCFLSNEEQLAQLRPPSSIFHKENCFYLFAPSELVDEYISNGSYLIMPGWLAAWRENLELWGFDQPTAREFFHECAKNLVLLDTGVDPLSRENLREMAEYLDLQFQVIAIGLTHYRLQLTQMVLQWQLERARLEVRHSSQKSADYAMGLDLLTELVKELTEEEIIKKIFELFSRLFAPRRMVFYHMVNGQIADIIVQDSRTQDPAVPKTWAEDRKEECAWLEEEKGFYLRMSHQGQVYGHLEVLSVAFPENHGAYLSLAVPIARICSLAISNARLFQEVHILAITDSLTGLNNRRHFMLLADSHFVQSRRYGRPLSVMMLDIDCFKKVNDSYGHVVGDGVLVAVARQCLHEMRVSDVLARYGGEEFIALLPETDSTHAIQAAERIRQKIARLVIDVVGLQLNVTVSIGVATRDPGCPDMNSLIDRGDQALYSAKNKGRNQVIAALDPSTT